MKRNSYVFSFLLAIPASIIANSARGEDTQATDNLGEKLNSCVSQAVETHSGPDFSERNREIEKCQQIYPYKYKPDAENFVPPEVPPSFDFGKMRRIAEEGVRRQLIDPSSATFEWPNGFRLGKWKPFLRKKVEGFITCGFVNSKNRFGGYVGRTAFVVVVRDYSVQFVEIGNNDSFDFVAGSCQKSEFPEPQKGMLTASNSEQSSSIYDKISKLAELRDRGAINEDEFNKLKKELLDSL